MGKLTFDEYKVTKCIQNTLKRRFSEGGQSEKQPINLKFTIL